MAIETLSDIVSELAGRYGIYNAPTRCEWEAGLLDRIRAAVEVERRLAVQPAAAPCWACEGRGKVDMMSGSHGQSSWTETCPYCTTADKPGAVQS
jgi:hypothetical protein